VAQAVLSDCYLYGSDVEVDYNRTFSLLSAAAERDASLAAMQFQELEQEAWQKKETIEQEPTLVDRLRQFAQDSPVGFFRQKALEALAAVES